MKKILKFATFLRIIIDKSSKIMVYQNMLFG